ncbi:phospholipid transport system substrate-binding protein [Rhodobacter viridis]|uniref:Phospholipid transport system substrate-binding protein n=2 Tax=Rhodobacter viridis TaxID=1054202 RepID=A0A318U3Q4_9RHOB|nr:phospholipid transport system substrate-binding protein [Rhodobacter viridis]
MHRPGTPMKTPMRSDRRRVLLGGAAALFAATVLRPGMALALTEDQAKALIGKAVDDVNAAIASGKTGPALYAMFEDLYMQYADVPTIARSVLGTASRSATPAQMQAFTLAFRGYVSRKYGKRFREFSATRFEVVGARKVKSFIEVKSIAYMPGEEPFEVLWHVSDKSGKSLFFNMIIEGVNMLAAERTEIGAMVDARHGNLDALIADLKTAE